jgi:hypothetical protein
LCLEMTRSSLVRFNFAYSGKHKVKSRRSEENTKERRKELSIFLFFLLDGGERPIDPARCQNSVQGRDYIVDDTGKERHKKNWRRKRWRRREEKEKKGD